jgi:transposase
MCPVFLCIATGEGAMGPTACGLVASLIDWIEKPRSDRGHPRCPTEAVVETLQFFLREGVQWRELRATGDRVCGATLRRRLSEWSTTALLRRVHAALVRMVRSGPEAAAAAWDVIVDSCSVRAKRGGELTGPNPTDRGKRGTKYHLVVASDGIPLAALPSAANVHDTMLFPTLLRRALVVCAAIARLYADAAYHSANNQKLCLKDGILPLIRQRGEPHGSGLGTVRCVVEHANAWLLANKRLDRRNDRLTIIIDALLTAACIFVIANRLADY